MAKGSFEFAPGWETHLSGQVDGVLDRLGKDILSDMQRVVPVDTGELKDSLDAKVEDHVLIVSAGADHSAAVELGTEHMAAEPYMKPSVYKTRRLS